MKKVKCPCCNQDFMDEDVLDCNRYYKNGEHFTEYEIEGYCDKCDKLYRWKERWTCAEQFDFKEV